LTESNFSGFSWYLFLAACPLREQV
jgi:hypothetical protein